MEKETEKDYSLRDLYLDFKEFKIDIKTELQTTLKENFDRLTTLVKTLFALSIGLVTAFCIVFAYVYDNKLEVTKEHHQARMEKLENVLFSLASEDFTETIQNK